VFTLVGCNMSCDAVFQALKKTFSDREMLRDLVVMHGSTSPSKPPAHHVALQVLYGAGKLHFQNKILDVSRIECSEVIALPMDYCAQKLDRGVEIDCSKGGVVFTGTQTDHEGVVEFMDNHVCRFPNLVRLRKELPDTPVKSSKKAAKKKDKDKDKEKSAAASKPKKAPSPPQTRSKPSSTAAKATSKAPASDAAPSGRKASTSQRPAINSITPKTSAAAQKPSTASQASTSDRASLKRKSSRWIESKEVRQRMAAAEEVFDISRSRDWFITLEGAEVQKEDVFSVFKNAYKWLWYLIVLEPKEENARLQSKTEQGTDQVVGRTLFIRIQLGHAVSPAKMSSRVQGWFEDWADRVTVERTKDVPNVEHRLYHDLQTEAAFKADHILVHGMPIALSGSDVGADR